MTSSAVNPSATNPSAVNPSATNPGARNPGALNSRTSGPPVLPGTPGTPAVPADPEAAEAAPFDPLRLCIFATVALLGWLAGPVALVFFAGLGFVGYWKARRAGLTRSKCLLRDTRLVLGYLALLVVAGGVGIWWKVMM